MKAVSILIVLTVGAASPAFAAGYPVQGRWGESKTAEKGAVDCAGRRVIGFNGEQRTDSRGGVPAYRNVSVTPDGGPATFKIVDEFTNGQVNRGKVTYTLRKVDDDRIELRMQVGGNLTLQRCK
ncbi:MAG: hypothetical protein ACR2K5_12195 [Pseudolabrys sp.]